MKTALVLSGGNLKGSYQAGAIKKMDEYGLKWDAMYGVSVGAVNTFGYLYGDPKDLCAMWLSLENRKDVIAREPWYKIFVNLFPQYNMDPLRAKLKAYSKNKTPKKIHGVVAYVDLFTGELHHEEHSRLMKGKFIEAVIASASEPPFVKALDGRFMDGGIRDQTPLKKAIDDGAEKIYVILNNPFPAKMDMWESKFPHAITTISRAVSMISNEIFVSDIDRCLAYNDLPGKRKIDLKWIAPSKKFVGDFDVQPEMIREALNLGYEDADKFLE